MADRIITVTNPSIVTNDTLAGYNNYSDIDGQLGTTMTPTEATNGKIITLSDGVVHEVTTKPVGDSNGEFSAVVSNAVTVDLSVGYGLSFVGANLSYSRDENYAPLTADFEISLTFDSAISTGVIVSNGKSGVSTINSIQVQFTTGTSCKIRVAGTTIGWKESGDATFAEGDKFTLKRASGVLSLLKNDIEQVTIADDGFSWGAGTGGSSGGVYIGTYSPASNNMTVKLSTLVIDGDSVLPTTQSSGTPINAGSISLDLFDDVSVDNLYYAL